MDLPANQSVIDFNETSDLGKKYEGRFTVLCSLDLRSRHLLELEKTRLQGNYANPSDGLAGIATLLSELRIRIVDGPSWWMQSDGGYDISDVDILMKLNEKVKLAEIEWRTKLKEKAKKLQEETQKSQTSSNP